LVAAQRVLVDQKKKKSQKEVSRKMVEMATRETAKIRSQLVVEEEDGFIEEDCSVDWVSPAIYDTYLDEEVSSMHQVLVESPK
jgi:hypothetical protein